MLENRPIGFIGTNADFFSKKSVLPPYGPVTETVTPKNSLAKTDANLVNSLLFKGNTNIENLNFFGMNKAESGPGKPAGPITELPAYKIDDQGNTNACGTTSLTSVLKYFGSNVKDHFEIDKAIRSTRFDMFTAPGDMVNYAKSKGFKAGLKNNGSLEDITSFVDKGVPVLILIDPGDKFDFNMHWIVIKGYERNSKGEIDNLKVADPAGGWSYNQDVAELKKEWGNIHVGSENFPVLGGRRSFASGYNNLMIPVAPKNKVIKTPDGKSVNTNSIKFPDEFDTVQGYGSRVVSGGALLIDQTITAGQSIGKYVSGTTTTISNKVSSLAKSLGL